MYLPASLCSHPDVCLVSFFWIVSFFGVVPLARVVSFPQGCCTWGQVCDTFSSTIEKYFWPCEQQTWKNVQCQNQFGWKFSLLTLSLLTCVRRENFQPRCCSLALIHCKILQQFILEWSDEYFDALFFLIDSSRFFCFVPASVTTRITPLLGMLSRVTLTPGQHAWQWCDLWWQQDRWKLWFLGFLISFRPVSRSSPSQLEVPLPLTWNRKRNTFYEIIWYFSFFCSQQ